MTLYKKGLDTAIKSDIIYGVTLINVRKAIESGQPFEISMADGESYMLPHSDFIAVSPRGTTVTVYDQDDNMHVLPLLTMTGITYPGYAEAKE